MEIETYVCIYKHGSSSEDMKFSNWEIKIKHQRVIGFASIIHKARVRYCMPNTFEKHSKSWRADIWTEKEKIELGTITF